MGLVVVAIAGCRAASTGVEAGAASSEQAVEAFISAVRAEDLQAMSAVWGNEESPTRDRVERQELERRLLILSCHLRHNEARIGVAGRGANGRTVHAVEMTQDTKNATVTFTTIQNRRSGRWFVEDIDLRPVRAFCSNPSGGGHGV